MSGSSMRPAADPNGFTLLELMVALAVFGLAAMALLNLAGENTRTAASVETRAFAAVVAENRAIEALTDPAPPAIGTIEGVEPLAGRDWRWTRSAVRTDDPEILRIEVRVLDGARTAAELTVFRVSR
jgi:general secretion pathway protein I